MSFGGPGSHRRRGLPLGSVARCTGTGRRHEQPTSVAKGVTTWTGLLTALAMTVTLTSVAAAGRAGSARAAERRQRVERDRAGRPSCSADCARPDASASAMVQGTVYDAVTRSIVARSPYLYATSAGSHRRRASQDAAPPRLRPRARRRSPSPATTLSTLPTRRHLFVPDGPSGAGGVPCRSGRRGGDDLGRRRVHGAVHASIGTTRATGDRSARRPRPPGSDGWAGSLKPFLIQSPSQPDQRPEHADECCLRRDFAEVKELGALSSSRRTADRSQPRCSGSSLRRTLDPVGPGACVSVRARYGPTSSPLRHGEPRPATDAVTACWNDSPLLVLASQARRSEAAPTATRRQSPIRSW